MRRQLTLATLLLVGLAWSAGLTAAPCQPQLPHHIALRFEGTSWDPSEQALTREQIRAGFSLIRLALCSPGERADSPLATVVLRADEGDQTRVTLVLDDPLTSKRVERNVELSRYDSAGRALVLSVVTEELMRASWAELALVRDQRDAQQPEQPQRPPSPTKLAVPPPEVTAIVDRSLPTPPRRLALRLSPNVELHATSQRYLGGALGLVFDAGASQRWTFGVSAQSGLAKRTSEGELQSNLAAVTAAWQYRLLRAGRWSLDGGVGVSGGLLTLAGSANGSDQRLLGREASGLVAAGRGQTAVELALSERWSLATELWLGHSLLAERARYNGRTLGGTGGLFGGAGLALQGAL